MPISVDDFWKLGVESRLFSSSQAAALAREFAAQKIGQVPRGNGQGTADPLRELSRWLVSRNAATPYQARTLAAGRPGPFVFGEYQIIDGYDRGPLTGAFRARHVGTRFRVTLSFFDERDGHDGAALARLTAAARRAAAGSDDLVQIYQYVESDKRRFVALEDLPNGSLAERLEAQSIPPLGAACRIARQTAQAIAHLQSQGHAHGDIRPESIWFDSAGRVRLLHFPFFGCDAWTHRPPQRDARADYLAPELAGQRPPDARSDLYSLGCVLYRMLAGECPFAGFDLAAKPRAHAEQAPPALDAVSKTAPAALVRIVGHLLSKNPDLRFQQAIRVAEGLAPFAEESPADTSDTRRRDAFEAWLQSQTPAIERAPAPVAAAPVVATQLAAPAAALAPTTATPAPVAVTNVAAPIAAVAPAPVFGTSAATAIARPRRSTSPIQRAIYALAGVAAVLTIVSVVILTRGKPAESEDGEGDITSGVADSPDAKSTEANPTDEPAPVGPEENITSVGDTIWQAPTVDARLDLSYVPPGARVIIVLRTADLAAHPEGQKLFDPRTTGALGEWMAKSLPQIAGAPLDDLERVTISLVAGETGPPRLAYVFRYASAKTEAELLAAWGQPAPAGRIDAEKVENAQPESAPKGKAFRKDDLVYYLPGEGDGRLAVAAPRDEFAAILELEGGPPPMARELEDLAPRMNGGATISVLAAPDFLANDGDKLFVGPSAMLQKPLREFLETPNLDGSLQLPKALSATIVLNETLFLELRVSTTHVDRGAIDVARTFRERIAGLPDAIDAYVWDLALSPYSKPVLREFRKMLTAVDAQTRAGVEKKQVVLRSWLPSHAAHNLALATHLTLLERPGTLVATPAGGGPQAELTIDQKLQKKISLAFPKNDLVRALEMVAADIDVSIEILGNDLQVEGITRNQSFGIEERDQPAREILKKIMLKARPDGKLIYVVKPKEGGGPEMLYVTTRAAAASRGDKLPPEFAEMMQPDPSP